MLLKKNILLYIFIAIFTTLLFYRPYKITNDLSKNEKVQDFDYIFNNIKDGYPYIGIDINSKKWIDNKDLYIKRIKNTKNDDEFTKEISTIVSELDNKHTEVIDNKKRFEMFKKSYSNRSEYNFLNEKKVIERYNNLKPNIKSFKGNFLKKELILKDVVENKIGYIYLPSMTPQTGSLNNDLSIIENYLKERKNYNALIIDIRGNKGGINKYWQDIVSKIINQDITINGYRFYKNQNNLIKNYVNIEKIKLNPIKTFNNDINKTFSNNFDVYENTSYTIKCNNTLNFNGKIYLLVDNEVYSASDFFAMFCKNTKFATLIGKETSGDGGVLDPVLFKLPNSDLIVRMASCMYLNKTEIDNIHINTSPDFKINNSIRTRNFKNDKCINKVLTLENIELEEII